SGQARLTVPKGRRIPFPFSLHSWERRWFTPSISLWKSDSKLPAQAWATLCFFNFSTKAFVFPYFSWRNGQSNRLILVSVNIGPGIMASPSLEGRGLPKLILTGKVTAAAANRELLKNFRRFSLFINIPV